MLGLGLTQNYAGGPKHAVYMAAVGVSKFLARISKISLSFEGLYHSGFYAFDQHNAGRLQLQHKNYMRYSCWIGHELIFGHLGVYFSLGSYLSKHRFEQKRHKFSAKVGFNLYLNNYFKKFDHQLYLGAYVRAYGGAAELFELNIGYCF